MHMLQKNKNPGIEGLIFYCKHQCDCADNLQASCFMNDDMEVVFLFTDTCTVIFYILEKEKRAKTNFHECKWVCDAKVDLVVLFIHGGVGLLVQQANGCFSPYKYCCGYLFLLHPLSEVGKLLSIEN